MKTSRIIIGIVFAVCFANLPQLSAQIGPGPAGPDLDQIDRQITYFRGGDTNGPLLATAWSHEDRSVGQFFGVSLSGRCWVSGNITSRKELDSTNLESIVAAIDALPQPPQNIPPKERWLVVCGTRTNQWFKYIYDRANIPTEVEKLYEITGVNLEWFIPIVESQTQSSQGIQSLIASDTPIGVGFSSGKMEFWDLGKRQITDSIPYDLFPHGYDGVRQISQDGKVLVTAGFSGTCAVDLKTKQLQWSIKVEDQNGATFRILAGTRFVNPNLSRRIAIGGDKGRFLFISTDSSHTIERWDLASGKLLNIMATNTVARFLKVSRDGKILMVEEGSSISIWKADADKPSAHLDTGQDSCVSPDGQTIAIITPGLKNLQLWDWQRGTKKEVPLRLPNDSLNVHPMFWSPDGKLFAAHVSSYVDNSTIVYDAKTWKPLARWICNKANWREGFHIENFGFENDGKLLQLNNGSIYFLDINALKSSGD